MFDAHKAIDELMSEKHGLVKVESNQRNAVSRYYVENCGDEQWDNAHHLIELDNVDPLYATLVINQMSSSGTVQVKLDNNEVLALASLLLNWYVEQKKRMSQTAEELIKRQSKLDDQLDDHPFNSKRAANWGIAALC